MQKEPPSLFRLILVPSLITLAVTLLRLFGELRHWSARVFNPEPGGGGSILGISWLAVVFAIYFAVKVHKWYEPLETPGKAIGRTVLALVLCIVGTFLMVRAIQSATVM